MKKILCALTAAALLFGCAGCSCNPTGQSSASVGSSSAPSEVSVSSEASEPITLTAEEEFLRDNLPKMDGSTSLIPLEAGIRATLFGISIEEATAQVVHSTTYGSFNNLLSDNCDLIFSTPLSAEQEREAAGSLTGTKIAAEGFVFVVNADNPVDTLTQQQLKDIYAGRITNWKQVGGNDAQIIAYQRNTTSGSQNYMIDFMKDDTLMDAPVELRPASMTGLMDVIALNDNSVNAIGYSVYAYAADMYGNGNEIKFIKVDGVAPNKQTMAAGQYPLMNYNYVFYKTDRFDEDSAVVRLVKWLTSYAGQLAIAKAGYVTVTDIGFNYTEMKLDAYTGKGSGSAAPADTSEQSYLYRAYYNREGNDNAEGYTDNLAVAVGLPTYREYGKVTEEEYNRVYTDVGFTVKPLSDAALTEKVNTWLAEAVTRSKTRYDEIANILKTDKGENEYSVNIPLSVASGNSSYFCYTNAEVKIVNGWLCAAVYTGYNYSVMDGYDRYIMAESAFFDLFSGEQVSLSDMFYGGTDIAAVLNPAIPVGIHTLTSSELSPAIELKTDFAGLTKTGWCLTFDGIVFGNDNPYFSAGMTVPAEFDEGSAVWLQPRDMSGKTGESVTVRDIRIDSRRTTYHEMKDGVGSYALLDVNAGENPEIRAKINAAIVALADPDGAWESMRSFFADKGITVEKDNIAFYDWWLQEYYGKFVVVFQPFASIFIDNTEYQYPENSTRCYCYSLKTGEEMQISELLKDGWRDHATFYGYDENYDEVELDSIPDGLTIMYAVTDSASGSLLLRLGDKNDAEYRVYIDPEWVIWD